MCARDNNLGTLLSRTYNSLDIEYSVTLICDGYCRRSALQEALGTLHSRSIDIAQHLQAILRPSRHSSQSHSDRQTRHSAVRNTHAHSILEDVGTQLHSDSRRSCAESFARLCHTERNRHWLGATYRENNLSLDKVDNFVVFVLCHSAKI